MFGTQSYSAALCYVATDLSTVVVDEDDKASCDNVVNNKDERGDADGLARRRKAPSGGGTGRGRRRVGS